MAEKLKTYEVEYEDGSKRYRQLNSDDAERFKAAASNKGSTVKAVREGSPDPTNATTKQRTPAKNK